MDSYRLTHGKFRLSLLPGGSSGRPKRLFATVNPYSKFSAGAVNCIERSATEATQKIQVLDREALGAKTDNILRVKFQ
jgi:hypothetical protein